MIRPARRADFAVWGRWWRNHHKGSGPRDQGTQARDLSIDSEMHWFGAGACGVAGSGDLAC